uniref:J domain-containing protein n=1 Tax=Chromera velia CCMP2878 TaxID=1169474 RepID=A0A0G4HR54_9ALVE|eukprot:Cvel_8083.t1-p1 / transcript=Cvel_8083.t1 / gene=Cvel_8083 / organism=Chromera_velia_CCMP2878 / gene_product=DnaJ homolog subfamily B member 6, putative / transcript_product=DnaJ homolog subfamily B member 6, putative / location=Cvel_scaffold438:75590-78608(-) / protein_length=372 / sequence_SO=supercontig / SO=protein_coding / is_pseudo=false
MAAEFDYYEILGVSRGCEEGEIKKAYKKLAIQWHPDKNPSNREAAEDMFKKIAHAYAVLSNPEKRRMYDLTGHEDGAVPGNGGRGSGGRGGGGHFGEPTFMHEFDMMDAHRIFEAFFGGRSPFDLFRQASHGSVSSSGGSSGRRRGSGPGGAFGFGGSAFDDPFFSDPFADMFGGGGLGGMRMGGGSDMMMMMGGGGGGGSSSSSFSQSFSFGGGMGGMGMGVSSSSSTTTKIINGRKVTRTETTKRHADGRVERSVIEETDDGRGDVQRRQLEGPSRGGEEQGQQQQQQSASRSSRTHSRHILSQQQQQQQYHPHLSSSSHGGAPEMRHPQPRTVHPGGSHPGHHSHYPQQHHPQVHHQAPAQQRQRYYGY